MAGSRSLEELASLLACEEAAYYKSVGDALFLACSGKPLPAFGVLACVAQ